MFDHIGLKVKDLDASVRFYRAAMGKLGYVLASEGEGYAGFGPPGEPALWLYAAAGSPVGTTHVAFRAADRKQAALDQQLTRHIAVGGAERASNRQLARARRRTMFTFTLVAP